MSTTKRKPTLTAKAMDNLCTVAARASAEADAMSGNKAHRAGVKQLREGVEWLWRLRDWYTSRHTSAKGGEVQP